MAQIEAGRIHRLRNRALGRYLNLDPWQDTAELKWFVLSPVNTRNPGVQQWHVFPVDGQGYLLVNAQRGWAAANMEDDHNTPILVARPHRHDGRDLAEHLVWTLTTAEQGLTRIQHRGCGAFLEGLMTPQPNSTAVAAEYPRKEDDSQVWTLEQVREDPRVTGLSVIDRQADDIGEVTHLTGFERPPTETAPVLIGQIAVPFPLVVSPLTNAEASARSPYFLLKRYGFWEQTDFHDDLGDTARTRQVQTAVGLVSPDPAQVLDRAGWSVTADGEAVFGQAGVLAEGICQALKLTRAPDGTQPGSKPATVREISYPGDQRRRADVVWSRADRYVLEYLDGTPFYEWTTRGPEHVHEQYVEPLLPEHVWITARHSGKRLQVEAGKTDNGTAIVQQPSTDDDAQKFTLTWAGGGSYRITPKVSGKALDVKDGKTENGQQVIQWDWAGGPNQRYRIEPFGEGDHVFTAAHSGQVLDIRDGRTDDGQPLIQWPLHGGPNQRFGIDPISDADW
ncbi:RICIN domain-containing protein [Umezawaea sp.]|uniref:RICIN domain-containing protein n=1 Tax=Umezawaea sp. TaxID=1955258 RepID=UPI002ECFB004